MLFRATARSCHVSACFARPSTKRSLAHLPVGPRYLGPCANDSRVGDYYAQGEGRAWLPPAGVRLISNICRHRQTVMLKGRGNSHHNIVPAAPLDVQPRVS